MNLPQFLSDQSNYPLLTQVFSLANIVLIFFTAIISFFSWRSAGKANELQLLPLLAVYFRGKAMRDRQIRIRNIGKSPAYDIKIESFTNIITDIQRIWKLDLTLAGTNVLIPDEERDLQVRGTVNGDESNNINDFLIFHLDPEADHDRSRTDLILTFRNAAGNCYYAKVETGQGGLFIAPAKRVNWRGKLFLAYRSYREKLELAKYRFYWRFQEPHIATPKSSKRK